MREIKFRAFWKNNAYQLFRVMQIDYRIPNMVILTDEEIGHINVPLEDVELMQFTGLHDKNGKEIYEGDIFAFDDEVWQSSYTSCGTEYDSWEVKNYGVVGFDEETARYDFVKYKYSENSVEADLHENHDLEFSYFVQDLEVIGNIYENPELLGGNAE